jgi:ABC-2 type transport system permease protein
MLSATRALASRALMVAMRRPQFLMPMLVFPSLLLAVNSGGLSQAANLPGFPPVPSFFDFQIPAAIAQSLLLGGVGTGIAVALELELGFFERLVAAPIPRSAIVLGRLLAAAAIALIQVTWFLILGLIFGHGVADGFIGLLEVYLIGSLAAIGFAGIGLTLAFRAGNASSVQGIFPLVFVILFLSSAFFPVDLLTSPVDVIARWNPLSYIATGMRAPIIGYGGTEAVLEGIAAAAGIALFFGGLATHALHRRLRLG